SIKHTNVDKSCGNNAATCSHYNIGDGDPKVFKDALVAIQKSVLGCTFGIPEVDKGIPDITQVKVLYRENSGDDIDEWDRVTSEELCGTEEGWYFDDPLHPKIITLCPAACKRVEADEKPSVNVKIPCEGS
ncbi:MAG: hypothetical protein FWD57_07225, partial [Polyangiaceae bacterium]|nr:hypothetical protein [Polyangiaceae bacterium]